MYTDDEFLKQLQRVWNRKPILREIYADQFYQPLLDNLVPGTNTVEIGSGPGFLREIAPDVTVWRTDILHSRGIHCVNDAHFLPFAANTLDNVIGLDVLHHLNRPIKVLREIARVLRPGGRFALVEPWITPFSRMVYTYLHHEDCDLEQQPWLEDDQFGPSKKAFEGNAAIPYLLVQRGRRQVASSVPDLVLREIVPFSSLTYLLSMGFRPGHLLPGPAYRLLYRLETLTKPLWVDWAALRALIIWEKSPGTGVKNDGASI